MTHTEQEARAMGYTRKVYIEGGMEEGHFLVKPETDLDGIFKAYSLDWEPGYYMINSYNCFIEEA